MNSVKGMTLIEMLLSLSIFTVMFIFITQLVQQSRRQALKIRKDMHNSGSFDNVIELIKEDLNSIAFLFDLNDNLKRNFPLNLESKTPALNSAIQGLGESLSQIQKPVFMSPSFVFSGEDDKMEFVSYSLTETAEDSSLKQWIQIRYFVEDCPSLDNSSSNPCLMRASKKSWSLEKEREEEETLTLLRGFKSLNFSYLESLNPLDQSWKDSWKLEKAVSFSESSAIEFPQELPFPFRIRFEIETQKDKQVWDFNVANPYLRSWNPFSKDFFQLPKWEPSKESTKRKKPVESVR